MALACTFALVCDACQVRISTTSQNVQEDLTIPQRAGMMDMDLCPPCLETAKAAVRAALGITTYQPNVHPAPGRQQ